MKNWPTGSLEERVRFAIDEVRPALMADGGNIHLLGVDGNRVLVTLSGACRHCPMAQTTLSDFVLERILLYAPEIESLENLRSTCDSGSSGTGP